MVPDLRTDPQPEHESSQTWPRAVMTRVQGHTSPERQSLGPSPPPWQRPHDSLQLPTPGPRGVLRTAEGTLVLCGASLAPRSGRAIHHGTSASEAGPGAGEAEANQWGVTGCSTIPR